MTKIEILKNRRCLLQEELNKYTDIYLSSKDEIKIGCCEQNINILRDEIRNIDNYLITLVEEIE